MKENHTILTKKNRLATKSIAITKFTELFIGNRIMQSNKWVSILGTIFF